MSRVDVNVKSVFFSFVYLSQILTGIDRDVEKPSKLVRFFSCDKNRNYPRFRQYFSIDTRARTRKKIFIDTSFVRFHNIYHRPVLTHDIIYYFKCDGSVYTTLHGRACQIVRLLLTRVYHQSSC